VKVALNLMEPVTAVAQPKKKRKPTMNRVNRRLKRRRVRHPRLPRPQLKFTPYAWAKLLWLRDAGPTEIGGFGIAPGEDPFLIEEIRLVKQRTTEVSVKFEDESVADLFDELVDDGLRPEQFGRIWIHTHPDISAQPSGVDETTFESCFGSTDWSVMFILARQGETYGRLKFNIGPGSALRVETSVDWSQPFPEADHAAWEAEYRRCVQPLEERAWLLEDWESLVADGTLTREEVNQLKQEYHQDDNIDTAFYAASGFDPRIHADPYIDDGDRSRRDRTAGGVAADGDRGEQALADRF
jgi:proteasome lid subunit RPN8/RPN11